MAIAEAVADLVAKGLVVVDEKRNDQAVSREHGDLSFSFELGVDGLVRVDIVGYQADPVIVRARAEAEYVAEVVGEYILHYGLQKQIREAAMRPMEPEPPQEDAAAAQVEGGVLHFIGDAPAQFEAAPDLVVQIEPPSPP